MTNPAEAARVGSGLPESADLRPVLEDEPFRVPILNRSVPFEGAVWDIRREEFTFNGETLVRDFVDHTGAVAVFALDEQDRVLLIKQYRHPVRTKEWEIPAGLLDFAGESPLVAAQRELAEETDMVAAEWHLLSEYFTSPGGSDEAIRIYLARGLSSAPEVFERTAEESDMELRWVGLDELVEAVLARRVQNSLLMIGTLAAKASRDAGWASLGDADSPWPRHPKIAAQTGESQADAT